MLTNRMKKFLQVFMKRKGKEPRGVGYVAALDFMRTLNSVTATLIVVSLLFLALLI